VVTKLGKPFGREFVNKRYSRFFRGRSRLRSGIGFVVLKSEFLAYLICWNLGVLAVAERLISALLAIAEVGVAAFFGGECFGGEGRSFVRSIAARLV